MSVEEAIEILKNLMESSTDSRQKLALHSAVIALNYEIEKVPNTQKISLIDGEEINDDENLDGVRTLCTCPECGYDLGYIDEFDGEVHDRRKWEIGYCPKCGQSIKFPKL